MVIQANDMMKYMVKYCQRKVVNVFLSMCSVFHFSFK